MILTVTLNPALDLTYRVATFRPQRTHRVREVLAVAGGKGINVARVLAACGKHVIVTGLAGGVTGRQLRDNLAHLGIPDAIVEIGEESRRTVVVHAAAPEGVTVFNEPGPPVTAQEWRRFQGRFAELLPSADMVVLSGSLPQGVPADAYATLVRAAGQRGVATIVDTSGAALRAAVEAGPEVIKPNGAELADATGVMDPLRAAARLRASGAAAVVASLGPDGLLALTDVSLLRARPPEEVTGNATGAGDAAVAALAMGRARGEDWPETLRRAVALSAAAVAMPRAGDVDFDLAARFHDAVTLEVADAPRTHR